MADLLGVNPWQIRKDFSYFDTNPKKIGRKVKNITIEDVSNLSTLKKRKISLAIIAVPWDKAQQAVDALVKAGIKGILNFSPCYIRVPKKVKVITHAGKLKS